MLNPNYENEMNMLRLEYEIWSNISVKPAAHQNEVTRQCELSLWHC